jgi:hypothetical protein
LFGEQTPFQGESSDRPDAVSVTTAPSDPTVAALVMARTMKRIDAKYAGGEIPGKGGALGFEERGAQQSFPNAPTVP